MTCYNATDFEAELSVKLGVPLYAPAPDLQIWGTKSGSRQVFAESNVPHPDGSPLVKTVDVCRLRLDYESFQLTQPLTTGVIGKCDTEHMQVMEYL